MLAIPNLSLSRPVGWRKERGRGRARVADGSGCKRRGCRGGCRCNGGSVGRKSRALSKRLSSRGARPPAARGVRTRGFRRGRGQPPTDSTKAEPARQCKGVARDRSDTRRIYFWGQGGRDCDASYSFFR